MNERGADGSAAVTTTTACLMFVVETWTAVRSSRIDSVNGVATLLATGSACVWENSISAGRVP